MQLTSHRTSRPGEEGIHFPKMECWNPVTRVATVAANVDKQRVLCRVSLDALSNRFGASEEPPMGVVARHRLAIQDAARTLIERGAYEEDGSVIIRQQDL